MEVVQIKHQGEMERALKALQIEIDQSIEEQKLNLEKAALSKLESQKDNLRQKVAEARDDKQRKMLMD